MNKKDDTKPLSWHLPDVEVFVLPGPFGMSFEISVAVPASYISGDQNYPVIIFLDAPSAFPIAVTSSRSQAGGGAAYESIIVGISTLRSEGPAVLGLNRLKYLTPGAPPRGSESIDIVLEMLAPLIENRGWTYDDCFGGASEFSDFLESTIVAKLLKGWRIDPSDVAICGHSAAAAFAVDRMVHQSAIFSKYAIGTFGTLWWDDLDELTASFVQAREALTEPDPLIVYHAMGGQELEDPAFPVEHLGLPYFDALAEKQLSAMKIRTQVFQNENHFSVVPAFIGTAIRELAGTNLNLVDGIRRRLSNSS